MAASKQYRVVVQTQADLDAAEAYEYYENQLPGLGDRFLDALESRYTDLEKHPGNYSIISEDSQQVLRDVMLKRFPFTVVYEIVEDIVTVYAVHHSKRER